jgi:hypothetical protein
MPKFVSEDGRQFTDYSPSCSLNQFLQQKYNVTNSHEYRYFLQRHAEQVMKDMANCDPKSDCSFCPVCEKTLEWKPKREM